MTLDREDIDAIVEALAPKVAELLDGRIPAAAGHVSADQVAALLGVSRDWVYDHKAHLGAIRVGEGSKGALRFPMARISEVLAERTVARPVEQRPKGKPGPRRGRRRDIELVPLRDWAR